MAGEKSGKDTSSVILGGQGAGGTTAMGGGGQGWNTVGGGKGGNKSSNPWGNQNRTALPYPSSLTNHLMNSSPLY